MAELDIGKHCSLPECKQLDFLPFVCDGCEQVFCKEHQVKDRHSCSKSLLKGTDRSTSTPYQTYKCSLKGCRRSELVPVQCDHCNNNYCMVHRHAADHRCGEDTLKRGYMTATAQHVQGILERQEASASKPRRAIKTKKAQAMAAKVALMKLKQTSTGDAGVPVESRVYVSVQLPAADASLKAKYSAHWLDQEWTVGRSVDYISAKCRIRNDNNKSNCPHLRLSSEGGELYSIDSKLKELVDTGSLHSGSTVELCYISEDGT